MTYHISNLGAFGGRVQADKGGYVYTTTKEVLSGNWDTISGPMSRYVASQIARANRENTREAGNDIAKWQSRS
jgi:hypothetical protein